MATSEVDPVPAPSPEVERALHPLVRVLRWLRRRVHGLYRALGLLLIIALVVALAAIWLFAQLAQEVMAGATQRFDDRVLEWIHRYSSPTLDSVALQVTAVGNGATVVVITLIGSAFLWVSRQRGALLLFIMAVVGADLGQLVLKAAFQRPRPELFVLATPFARPVSTSFPSGHATGAIAVYLVLGYLLWRQSKSRAFRWLVITVAGLLVIAIGLTRMYLGVHYPSDVIAGYLIGVGWVTFCIAGLETIRIIRRRSGTGPAPR